MPPAKSHSTLIVFLAACAVLAVAALAGSVLLVRYLGSKAPDDIELADLVAHTNEAPASRATSGKWLYNHCIACHGPKGKGIPSQFPPLANNPKVLDESPDDLIRITLHGLTGPLQTKGAEYHGVCVPWRGLLTDAQIASICSYIRQNAEWHEGQVAPPVSPEQVAAIRAAGKDRKSPWTVSELEKLRQQN